MAKTANGKKAEKAEKKNSGKNVVSEVDRGDFIEMKRKVSRNGMTGAIEYTLKIPKTLKWAIAEMGETESLRLLVASLKTENDDAVKRSGTPISEDKAIKALLKTASPEKKKAMLAELQADVEKAKKA